MHADVRLLSSTDRLGQHHDDILEGETELPSGSWGSQSPSRISLKTVAVVRDSWAKVSDVIDYFEGSVFNDTVEPDSRFEVKKDNMRRAGGGGKVDIHGARESALQAFGDDEKEARHDQGAAAEEEEKVNPMITVATGNGGKVTLETLEWMETIKRRFGVGKEPGDGQDS